jgi:hypothetical protein
MKKKLSLLEKARLVTPPSRRQLIVKQEHIDLAIAWLKDEITMKQVSVATDSAGAGLYTLLGRSLKEAYLRKQLKFIKKGDIR